MPNIFKFFSSSDAKEYTFPEVTSPELEEDEQETADAEEPAGAEEEESVSQARETIDYAHVQAQAIMHGARQEADEFLEQARAQAKIEAERLYQEAKEDGFRDGYAQGLAQAQEESAHRRDEEAAKLAGEVQRFLEKAGAALDQQMDKNMEDLKDLAIAIAEKVICVSLRSSTDIIARMVQTALDKRKHREWVYVYIAESDVRQAGQIPASLMSAVSGLSDRVRIIPMADDESGTCVIEMPEEIIDASVSTQLGNIRSMLTNIHQDAADTIPISF